jgi:uncharacterized RDD family membrane protein YckC
MMTRYQTFCRRFWAAIIDGLVLWPITILDDFFLSPDRDRIVLIIWSIFTYTIYWLYSVLLHARYGQTFGKMATGVKVLDVSEERIPTLRQSFLRDIGYIVPNILSLCYLIYQVVTNQYFSDSEVTTLPGDILALVGLGWFLLEIFSMLTNNKRRALHDYIAKTVVVRSR